MSQRLALAVWFVSLVLAPRLALAQPAPPALNAPVNDFAQVIDAASAAELERRIRALQAASGDVVVVATVPTFQPYGDIRELRRQDVPERRPRRRRQRARTTAC